MLKEKPEGRSDTQYSDVGKGLLICKTLSSQILHFGEVIT